MLSWNGLLSFIIVFLLSVPYATFFGSEDVRASGVDGSSQPCVPSLSRSNFNGSISIESDSEFTSENGVSSGTGTQSDPFIIEGIELTVDRVPAIRVANTTVHLLIRNVTVQDRTNGPPVILWQTRNITLEGTSFFNGSLRIEKCYSVKVLNCTFVGPLSGLIISDIQGLDLIGNIMNGTGFGCSITGPSNDCLVKGNRIFHTDQNGLEVSGSFNDLDIVKNNLSDNGHNGVLGDSLNGNGIFVRENELRGNLGFGAFLKDCRNLTFIDNVITGNPSGGILGERLYGRGVDISWNNVSDNGVYGMELQGVVSIKVTNNSIRNNGQVDVLLGSGSSNNRLEDNIVQGGGLWGRGIIVADSGSNILRGNIVSHRDIGLEIDSRGSQMVTSNNINNCYTGILLETSSGNTISNNRIEDSLEGIVAVGSTDGLIMNNSISDFYSCIHLDGCSSMTISANRFIVWQFSPLDLSGCTDVLIYNNYFTRTWIDYGDNDPAELQWSLPSRIPGTNIVGGPFLLGNFWEQYDGEDIDGDGIGDTKLPYGPGDHGPLVMDYPPPDHEPPNVVYKEGDLPITGEEWTGDFQVMDNRSLYGVRIDFVSSVQLDLDKNVIKGSSIEDIGLDENGNFTFSLIIDRSAVSLNITIRAIDFSGNFRDVEFDLRVLDTKYPDLIEVSYPTAIDVGDEFKVTLEVMDNVGIIWLSSYCEFDEDIGPIEATSRSLNEKATIWEINLTVPENATVMVLNIDIFDHGGNPAQIVIDDIELRDVIPPTIMERTVGRPETGRTFDLAFVVQDNWELDDLRFLPTQDGILCLYSVKERIPLGSLIVSVKVLNSTRRFEYVLTAKDKSGNYRELRGEYLVVDVLEPTIDRLDAERPMTGMPFEMSFAFYDNWGNCTGLMEWSFDDAPVDTMDMTRDEMIIPEVPLDALEFHYRTWIVDESGNRAELSEDLSVLDATLPELEVNFPVAKTSSEWEVWINVSDNRRVNITWLNWSFDNGPPMFGSGPLRGPGPFIWPIMVPDMARTVQLYCYTKDLTGLISIFADEVEVADGTPPRIEDLSFRRVEGDSYKFSLIAADNRGSITAWVVLYDAEGNEKRLPMESSIFEGIHLKLSRSRLKGYINYSMLVMDSSGLTTYSERYPIVLEDDNDQMMTLTILLVLTLVIIFSIVIIILRAMIVAKREIGTYPSDSKASQTRVAPEIDGMTKPREVLPPPEIEEE